MSENPRGLPTVVGIRSAKTQSSVVNELAESINFPKVIGQDGFIESNLASDDLFAQVRAVPPLASDT